MKRICIVNYYLYYIYHPELKQAFGGAEVQLYNYLQVLKQDKQFDLHVLSLRSEQSQIVKEDTITFWRVRDLELRNDKWYQLLINTKNVFKAFVYLIKIRPDVCITRAASFDLGLVALYCRLFRKKCIYMAASSIDVDGSFMNSSSWVARNSYFYGLTHSDVILVQNQEQQLALSTNYTIESEILPNGFPSLPLNARQASQNTILWVGRAQAMKQPEIFIDLAHQFPEQQFVMILASQDPAVLEAVQRTTRDLANFTLLQSVRFQDTDQYYAEAKLLINTSTFEGFPNTFIQAGLAGCPILSYIVNPDTVLTTHQIGWCADGDIKKFSELFNTICTDTATWKEYSKNIAQYMRRQHDITATYQILLRAIQS